MALQYPNPFPMPFAVNGQTTEIPVEQEVSGDGFACWNTGFGPELSQPLPPRGNGKTVSRLDFNTMFNLITAHLVYMQSGGLFAYNPELDYKAGQSLVTHNGMLWVCVKDIDHTQGTVEPGTDMSTWQSLLSYMKAASAPTVGNIILRPINKLPANALLCDGKAYSRTEYALLFDEIGTYFGEGDGSTTFNVPDYRGYFPRFWDGGRGIDSDPAREPGSVQNDAIRNIKGELGQANRYAALIGKPTGPFVVDTEWGTSTGIRASTNTDNYWSYTFDASQAVPTATENRPKNMAIVAAILFE